ncbi:hypothetical protein [Paenibacillus elgii]|uniref:hypothetical protein n=1 Tax=Paenibacillus elgii TaxID=189691 RepID=UPI0013D25A9F|nr:hypothetical protein [Paenibacillus elgii]
MFRLPLLFIATGIASFVLFHAGSLFTAGGWVLDHPRSPDGWFRVHLLVLDWATMVAMGAVYQLIDVVLQRRIYSRMLGYVHYVFFTGGTVILLAGFLQSQVEWIAVGAVAAVIGILLFVWNVGRTLWEAKRWNPIILSTACALLYLALTGLLGLAMGLNFAFQLWADLHERLLAAHIWLGTLGWFGLLITGFSYKMLPMFYLSHGASDRPQYYIFGLWNAAVLLGVGAFLVPGGSGPMLVGILLLAAALLVYDRHIRDIRKHSHKASPGRGIVWTIWSARALLIFCILTLCIGLAAPSLLSNLTWIVIAGWVYLWGWVAVTVLGYMSKIVPFLWWTHKYGDQAGRPGVPVMSDLISERSVDVGMWVMAVGLLVAVAGMGFMEPWAVVTGIAALSAGALFYIGVIARVFTR